MYKITYVHKNETEENTLYIPGSREYCLTDALLSVECGKSGELSISIPDANPAKADIQCLTDEVIVYRNDKEIWRGRPITMQIDFNLTGNLTCEGILSYLYDTYFEPFEFEGSPKELLQLLLDNHNSKVEERKRFKLGDVTVEDSNDYINRSSIYYDRTLSVMTDKLSGSSLGGMFRARVEDDGRYIDYIDAYNTESSQPVRYGYNLLDIAQDIEYGDLATVLLPLGARLEDEEGMETDERLTVESVNGGSIYLVDEASVEKYGWIVVEMEWDDVTVASNLLEKAQYALAQQIMPISQFTIEAVDMSLADPELDPINLGDFVLIRMDAMGMNQMVELTGMDIDILDPTNSTLQFGTDAATLSGTTANTARSIQESMNTMSVRFDNLSANVINAVYANIETIIAGTITTDYIQAAVADLGYVTADWVEANTISVQDLEAVYADIESLYADLANINALFANYATIESLTALEAYIADEYVSNAVISDLLAGYAKIVDLEAVYADISELNADMAHIAVLLGGEAGIGELETIHLTSSNAVIDEAVIVDALIGTVLADIIQSNVIYTDYITIMSLDGSYINTGSMEQFSDADGTVRIQIGLDASGEYNFYIADADGNLLWDALGLTEAGLTANGAIIKDAAIADSANIAASKLDIADLTKTLNENGQLVLTAEQITIGGGTLDYELTQINQQISDLESEGIEFIENYYTLTTNPDWYPPQGETEDAGQTSILGEMILGEAILGYGGESDWTTERLVAGDGEYLWYCQKITYKDGHIVWTTPTLITDDYIRTTLTIQQTELEVVQGQIQAKVWQSDIDTAVNSLNDEITTITDQYALLTITLNEIDQRVGSLTTTVDQYYTELSSQVTSLTLDLDGITARVTEVSEKTANAIVEGVPYYATSTNPDWYPPHESSGSDTSILGEMVLGEAILGYGGPEDWTEEQPEAEEGQYVWISYLRTRVDGSTYWTEPTLLTDEWARLSYAEMSERYSQLVLTIDTALLEVYSAITTVEGSVTELDASIREYVDETSADILSEVAGLYVTDTEFTSTTASIEQYISDETASIRSDLRYYATTTDVATQITNVTNEINQTITETEASILSTVEGTYVSNGTFTETTASIEQLISSTESTILSTVSSTYATNSDLKNVSDLADYLNDNSVANVETYYAVSNNESSPAQEQNIEVIGEGDFTGNSLPSGWIVGYNGSPNSAEFYDSPTLGRCYRILRAGSNIPYVRETVSYKEGYCKAEFTVATEEGYEDHAVVRHGRQGYYAVTEEGQIRSDKWTTIEAVYNMASALTTYFYIYNYSDYEYSVPLLLRDVKVYTFDYEEADWSTDYPEDVPSGSYIWVRYLITYTDGHTEWTEPFCSTMSGISSEISQNTATIMQYVDSEIASIDLQVTNGELGKTASIKMTAGSSTVTQEIDMENVRQAFADDKTAITIKAGTVEFDTGTLIVNGGNFTLDSSGNATFSGNLKSPTGNIGGWYIDEYNLFNMDATNGIVYLSPSMILLGASSVTVDSSGNVTSQDAKFSVDRYGSLYSISGKIGGWTIADNALYDKCVSIDDDTVGAYLGPDGVRINVTSSSTSRNDSFVWGGSNGSLALAEYGTRTYSTGGATYYPEVRIQNSGIRCSAYGYSYANSPIGGVLVEFDGIYVYDSDGDDWFSVNNANQTFYLDGSRITASDESIKKDLKPIDDTIYDSANLFDSLQVETFEYISDKSNKTHVGFTYQNVVSALEKAGINPETSAMVGYVEDEDGNKKYGIEYDDIVALLVYEVQQLKKQVNELQATTGTA